MIFALFRTLMDFIEHIRVNQEHTQAGFGAEIDGPTAIFDTWKICRVGISEHPSAEGDETLALLLFQRMCMHMNVGATPA
jgi:hypothetical protein